MLDVRRLQVLRAVVSSGSISAAARNLGYTPSAISQQLSTLEREAGAAVLERVGRGVRPTPAGTLLAEHAEILGRQVAEAEAALTELKQSRGGRLSVRYFATAGASLVPPAVAALRRAQPDLHLDLKLVEPDDPLPLVASGEADVAIVVFPRPEPPPRGVRLVHLLDDPYRAVVPVGHPLSRKRIVDLADLADEPWIGNEWPPGPCLHVLVEACAAAGFSPTMVVESEDYQTAQGFVAAGLGVTVIPVLALGNRNPKVVVRRLRNPEPVRVIHAAVRESALERPAVRTLLAELRAAAVA
ncbi:DNA-binding transcriptional LysR family regulator [Herbihabitans rhizosphaerae]|uniref:DNA-binding transcriptional LysR family regulator n=1 Tax=Herbihabitans rhizosphaerae TaxID=1872711 RepID=A0A4Q7KTN4_9PSEU|nr:LysR family transcriptional regulator [Herbihabitans rhizosphaerae]RZS38812.1 DNA-binding transcriptional LysR family regulator [Herbihabitans rhizosphaerae]